MGCGVNAGASLNKSKSKGAGWLTVNWGWGIAVFSGVLVAAKSGGHLNPAVTVGMLVAQKDIGGVAASAGGAYYGEAVGYIVAQFIGAFIGAALVWLAYKKQFDENQDNGVRLGVFSTGPEVRSTGWNLVTEAIGTFVLVFVVLISGYQGNASNLGWLNALGVAILIVGIGASLGGPTGYAINPARDLGPRLWHAVMPCPGKDGNNWGYSWIPVVGPILGAIVAALVFIVTKSVYA
jgi:glycerol uptake facilitator protein